jgi:hypothetical protein
LEGFENVIADNGLHTSSTSCTPIADDTETKAAVAATAEAATAVELEAEEEAPPSLQATATADDDDVATVLAAAAQGAYYGGVVAVASSDSGGDVDGDDTGGDGGDGGGSYGSLTGDGLGSAGLVEYDGGTSADDDELLSLVEGGAQSGADLPTRSPTQLPCVGGDHDCDTTSTYCAGSAYASASYFCLCLDGYMRKIENGMRSNNQCVVDPTVPAPTLAPALSAPASAPAPAPAPATVLDASAGSVNDDGSVTLPTSMDGGTSTVSADGMVTTKVDGVGDVSVTTIRDDGSTVTEMTANPVPNAEGGTTATSTDGSSVSVAGDGTVVATVMDANTGEVVVSATTTPDGTVSTNYNMTGPTTVNDDGSTTASTPGGGLVTVSAGGDSVTTTDADGDVSAVTTINGDGTTATEVITPATENSDGGTSAANGLGEMVTVSQDGATVTTTDSQGKVATETSRNEDGSATTDISAVDGSTLEFEAAADGSPLSAKELLPPDEFSVTAAITLTGFTLETFSSLHQQTFARVLSELLRVDEGSVALTSVTKSEYAEPPPPSEGAAPTVYLLPANAPLFVETRTSVPSAAPLAAAAAAAAAAVEGPEATVVGDSSMLSPPADPPEYSPVHPLSGLGRRLGGRDTRRLTMYTPGGTNEYSPNDAQVYPQTGVEIIYTITCADEAGSKFVKDAINEIASNPTAFEARLSSGFRGAETTVPDGFSVTAWWIGHDAAGDPIGDVVVTHSVGKPTHMPTQLPCPEGSHECDTKSTYCASTSLAGDSSYFCLCLEGFKRIPGDAVRVQCMPDDVSPSITEGGADLAGAVAAAATADPAAPTMLPTFAPTQSHCTDGDHDCDLTTTYCASSTYAAAGYFCLCLEGLVRVVNEAGHDPTSCMPSTASESAPAVGELKAGVETFGMEAGRESARGASDWSLASVGVIAGAAIGIALAVAMVVGRSRRRWGPQLAAPAAGQGRGEEGSQQAETLPALPSIAASGIL